MATGGKSILEMWLEDTPNSNDTSVKKERRELPDLFNQPPPPLPASLQAGACFGGALSGPAGDVDELFPPLPSRPRSSCSFLPDTSSAFASSALPTRQPKITGSAVASPAKSAEIKPEVPAEEPIDACSIRGAFGWARCKEVVLPYILRKKDKLIPVRLVENKIINKYSTLVPWTVFSCINIRSYFITEHEAKLLNEINSFHCDYFFGSDLFTCKDVVVCLGDVELLHKFLDVSNLVFNRGLDKCDFLGFVELSRTSTVIPYITKEVPDAHDDPERRLSAPADATADEPANRPSSVLSDLFPELFKTGTGTSQPAAGAGQRQYEDESIPMQMSDDASSTASNQGGGESSLSNSARAEADDTLDTSDLDQLDRLLEDALDKPLDAGCPQDLHASQTNGTHRSSMQRPKDVDLNASQSSSTASGLCHKSSSLNCGMNELARLLTSENDACTSASLGVAPTGALNGSLGRPNVNKHKELSSLLAEDDDVILCQRPASQRRKYVPQSLLSKSLFAQGETMPMGEWDSSYLKMLCIYAGREDLSAQMGKVNLTAGDSQPVPDPMPENQLCLLDDLKMDGHPSRPDFKELRLAHPPAHLQESQAAANAFANPTAGVFNHSNGLPVPNTASILQKLDMLNKTQQQQQQQLLQQQQQQQQMLQSPIPPGFNGGMTGPSRSHLQKTCARSSSFSGTSLQSRTTTADPMAQLYQAQQSRNQAQRMSFTQQYTHPRQSQPAQQPAQQNSVADGFYSQQYQMRPEAAQAPAQAATGSMNYASNTATNPAKTNSVRARLAMAQPPSRPTPTFAQANSALAATLASNSSRLSTAAANLNGKQSSAATAAYGQLGGAGYDSNLLNQLCALLPGGMGGGMGGGMSAQELLQSGLNSSMSPQALANQLAGNHGNAGSLGSSGSRQSTAALNASLLKSLNAANGLVGRTAQSNQSGQISANSMLNDLLSRTVNLAGQSRQQQQPTPQQQLPQMHHQPAQRSNSFANHLNSNLNLINSLGLNPSLGQPLGSGQQLLQQAQNGGEPANAQNRSNPHEIYRVEIGGCTLRAINLLPYSNSLVVLVGEVVQKMLTGITYLNLISILEKVYNIQLFEFSKYHELTFIRYGYKPIQGDRLVSVDLLRKNLPHIKHFILTQQATPSYGYQSNSNVH